MLLAVTAGWAQSDDIAPITPTPVTEPSTPITQRPTPLFGYMSYDGVMQSLPEYVVVQRNLEQLRKQYEAEMKRAEDDFNKKYEEFLDVQATYPKTILQKRQSELQEMLNRNIAFKQQSQQLLAQAEAEAKAPLEQRLAEALTKLGQQRGYAFILNTDQTSALWLNPALGEDVSNAVLQLLK